MSVREVIRMGHPVLRQKAKPYPEEKIGTAEFVELIEDMHETLHEYGGIGLAAPQINVPYQIAIIEILDSGTRYGDIPLMPFGVYINPTITTLHAQQAGYWEGCLSIPGIRGFVERPQHIRVEYTDDKVQRQSLEASGFLATVFQHEFDHLQGKLFLDHVSDPTMMAYEEEYMTYHLEN